MSVLVAELERWAGERGYRLAIGPPSVLDRASLEIEGRSLSGEFDETFRKLNFSSPFAHARAADLPWARALIVLAVPRPAHRVTFDLGDRRFQARVPPTYVIYGPLFEKVREEISSGPLAVGCRLETLRAPLKNIAARLGLVAYGRNNITFAPGLGSYQQLVGFATDADLAPAASRDAGRPGAREEGTGEARVLPECDGCDRCRKACPTGAIGEDRFLLRGERCLTFLNENGIPWPEWVPPGSHNALIGCLTCQEACPLDRGLLRFEDLSPGFTAEETARILEVAARRGPGAEGGNAHPAESDALWMAVKEKFARLGLPGLEDNAPGNLAALLAARRARAPAG